MTDRTVELPADVGAVLSQLLAAARTRVAAGEYELARDALGTVETVTENKVPGEAERERLLAGCTVVRETMGQDDETARGYLQALERRVRAARPD